MKFLNVFSRPFDSKTVTSSAPIKSSIAMPSELPYSLDSMEYSLEKQERRSINRAYASFVSFPDFPAPVRLGTSRRSAARWIESEVIRWATDLASNRLAFQADQQHLMRLAA